MTEKPAPTSIPPAGLSSQTESRRTRLALLAVVVVLALLSWPLFANRVNLGNDLGVFYLPIRHAYAQALTAGDSFIWAPSFYCGHYLQGEGQAGMTHPWHLLLYRTLPLDVAFNLEFLASYVVLGLGFFLLLRRWQFARSVAIFGGLVFSLGGYSMMYYVHPNAVAVIAHIPWLILCSDIVMCTRNRVHLVWAQLAVALLTASQILSGHPQYVVYSLLAQATFLLWRIREWASWWRLPLLLLAMILGLAMGAVQILPTWQALRDSEHKDVSLDYRLLFSLNPLNLLQLWSPLTPYDRCFGGSTHGSTFYTGAFCTVALPWLWIRRHSLGTRRGLFLFMSLLAGVCLVLAFGKYGGVYGPLSTLPLLKLLPMRCPSHFVLLVQLGMVILACIALTDLMKLVDEQTKIPWRRLWPLGLLAAIAVATALGGLWIHHGGHGPFYASRINPDGKVLAGLAIVLAATALTVAAARGWRWSVAGIIVLTGLEIAVLGIDMQVFRDPVLPLKEVTASLAPALPPVDGGRVHRIGDDDCLALRNYQQFQGLMSLSPKKLLNPRSEKTLRVAGVRYQQPETVIPKIWGLFVRVPTPWVFDNAAWTAIPNPLPKARFVSQAVVTTAPAQALEQIDVEQAALVEAPLDLIPGEPGQANLLADRPGHLDVAAATPTRQLLVLAESYHTGWRAAIDGLPAPVLRADGDFMGLVVEPGTHRVELRFQPWSFTWGLRISLLALAAALVGHLIMLACAGRKAAA